MNFHNSEPITLYRDCQAVLIPAGNEVTLPQGSIGYITQSLGGSFTVYIEGNLFLIHGILDDNVLFQDTVRLMQNLINEGKYFDLMAYPRDDHGIGKASSRPHVYSNIMRYLYWKLNRR